MNLNCTYEFRISQALRQKEQELMLLKGAGNETTLERKLRLNAPKANTIPRKHPTISTTSSRNNENLPLLTRAHTDSEARALAVTFLSAKKKALSPGLNESKSSGPHSSPVSRSRPDIAHPVSIPARSTSSDINNPRFQRFYKDKLLLDPLSASNSMDSPFYLKSSDSPCSLRPSRSPQSQKQIYQSKPRLIRPAKALPPVPICTSAAEEVVRLFDSIRLESPHLPERSTSRPHIDFADDIRSNLQPTTPSYQEASSLSISHDLSSDTSKYCIKPTVYITPIAPPRKATSPKPVVSRLKSPSNERGRVMIWNGPVTPVLTRETTPPQPTKSQHTLYLFTDVLILTTCVPDIIPTKSKENERCTIELIIPLIKCDLNYNNAGLLDLTTWETRDGGFLNLVYRVDQAVGTNLDGIEQAGPRDVFSYINLLKEIGGSKDSLVDCLELVDLVAGEVFEPQEFVDWVKDL